ncbi:MAG: hypothetical protein GY906_34830 [bacterium]|nr:hypothetical protein [bacterium]
MDRSWLPIVAMLLFVGCGGDGGDEVVAKVGDHRIEIASFQAYLSATTGEAWQAVDRRVATRLLDQFLDQEVIAASTYERDDVEIPTDPEARFGVIRGLVEAVCGPSAPIAATAIDEEVERRMVETTPIRVHVRQMLLGSEEVASAVRERLVKGEDWLSLSREVSLAPNADRGGEIGILQEGGLPVELEEVIFGLSADEISSPVQGPSGFHVFQVLQVFPAGHPDRGEVEWNVRGEFEQARARQHLRDCVDRLASEVGVVVHADRLWFDYQGRYTRENNAVQ